MGTALLDALEPAFRVRCPGCDEVLCYDDVVFPGMPILLEAHCPGCGRRFLLDWPAGHALLHQTLIDLDAQTVHHDGSRWYPEVLMRVLESRETPRRPPLSVRSGEPHNRTAVLVNCVDYVFGHCLLKLLSSLSLLQEPGVDLIVVVQKQVAWLVPAEVHTVVELGDPLADGRAWIYGLDATIKELLGRYEQVRIAPTPSQPRLSLDDLARTAPGFSPEPFWQRDVRGPQVTFVLREDRLWARRPLLPSGRSLLPGARTLLPRVWRQRLARRAQNRRVARVVRQLRAAVPEVQFTAVGLGRHGRLPAAVRDLRVAAITPRDHLVWCSEFLRSRLVIGVHGSNLHLPSALAGAVIDLLPNQKLPNVAQDLIIAGPEEAQPKLALFRYRILPAETSATTVSETAVSILRDANRYYLNMARNPAASGQGWVDGLEWTTAGRKQVSISELSIGRGSSAQDSNRMKRATPRSR